MDKCLACGNLLSGRKAPGHNVGIWEVCDDKKLLSSVPLCDPSCLCCERLWVGAGLYRYTATSGGHSH